MKNLATIIFISLLTIGLFSVVTYTSCKKTGQQEIPVCKNGGTYTNGTCKCAEGFEGKYCETKVEYCKQTPCQNGGVCVGTCRCKEGYAGKYCEIFKCDTVVCNNGGTCYNGACNCSAGYNGPKCDTVIRDKFPGTWKYYWTNGTNNDSIVLVIDKIGRNNVNELNVKGNIYYDTFSTVAVTAPAGYIHGGVQIDDVTSLGFSLTPKGQQLELLYDKRGDLGSHSRDTVLMNRY